MSRSIVIIAIAAVAGGCLFDTADTVPFAESDAGNDVSDAPSAADAPAKDQSEPDADETIDAAPDFDVMIDAEMPVEPRYPHDELPQGSSCPDVPTGGTHECNPVTQDCGGDQVCKVEIRGGDEAATTCRRRRSGETFEIPWGSSCDPASQTEHCVIGGVCLGGTCRRFCEFDGAYGCTVEQSCDEIGSTPGISPLQDFGACFDACEP